MGMFHTLDNNLQDLIVLLAMRKAPSTRKSNLEALERQHEVKAEWEELLRKGGIEKTSEEFIERFIYYYMSLSRACWQSAKEVNDDIKKMKYKKDQFQALKDNINK